jgi:SAM-dependent methyltransferase
MPLIPAYSRLPAVYDVTLGVPWFRHARRAFERLVSWFGIKFRRAADVGCGTGLFARYLNRRWRVPVFAIDRSPEMLDIARGGCVSGPVRFVLQDVRQLRLPQPVDLITAHYDMINHLTEPCDVRAFFRRVWENLRPGGHFLFDTLTPRQALPPSHAYVRRLLSRPRVWQVVRWSPLRRLLQIDVVHGATVPLATVERHWERAYSPVELVRWLREAGFHVRAVLDAQTLEIAGPEAARVYLLTERPARQEGCHGRQDGLHHSER